MSGGDLMDVLVAEAKIIKHPVPQKSGMRQGVLSPKVKMWQVCACVCCELWAPGF
jgi:cGMP-dependent protein kinase 2